MSDENKPKFHPKPNLKLIGRDREVPQYNHFAYRIEQTYCQRILHYIRYFGSKTHLTTEIYTQVMACGIRNLQSPLDKLISPKERS